MSEPTARDAKELFLDALELPEGERAAFLADLRARDAGLAERVEGLLGGHRGRAAKGLDGVGDGMRDLLRRSGGELGGEIGDYELIEEIDSGASGVVWRARQRSLDREVAVKLLRAGQLAGRREVERFRREAEAVARFDHPHIVPVYDVGEHDGRHFFSMRYFRGGSLADRVDPQDPWDGARAARMVRTIALAVHHAHQRGLLHRDLKPSNVLLDEDGTPAVADFGVAANIDDAGVVDATATIAGTPSYMAPEQAGAEASEQTVTTDVWALGCILYELVAGRPPFAAATVSAVLQKVANEEPFPLRALAPSVPRDLETIVLTCLRKDPGERYPSANALSVDLGRWLEHEPILARRTGVLERTRLAIRRSPVTAGLVSTVLVLLVVLASGAGWASLQQRSMLRDSYLEQAGAVRLSAEVGRRRRALELLERAAQIRPGRDVISEVIANLALTDLRSLESRPFPLDGIGNAIVEPVQDWIVDSSADHEIFIRDLFDGRVVQQFVPGKRVYGLRVSPGGEWIVAKLHDAETGVVRTLLHSTVEPQRSHTIEATWTLTAIDFSPDGIELALGDGGGRLVVVELATGEVREAYDLEGYPGCVRFAAEGRELLVGLESDLGGMLLRIDRGSGEPSGWMALPALPYAMALVPGEQRAAIGSGDFNAYLVTLESGAWRPFDDYLERLAAARDEASEDRSEEAATAFAKVPFEPLRALEGHTSEVVRLEVSSTLPVAATESWDKTVRLWDLRDGRELVRVVGVLVGFAGDGRTLVYRTLESYELAEVVHETVLTSLHGHTGKSPASMAFSADGQQLVSFGSDRALLWEVESGELLGEVNDGVVEGAAFSPDGRDLWLSSSAGLERRAASAPFEPGTLVIAGDTDHLGLSADGSSLAVRDRSKVLLFDTRPLEQRATAEGGRGLEYPILSSRGAFLAGTIWKGSGVSVWNGRDGALLGRLLEERVVLGAKFAPDEARLVVGDGVDYHVYAMPGLKLERVIERPSRLRDTPGTIAFSPDGRLLTLALDQDRVGLFDAASFERLAVLEARSRRFVGRATFDPTGRKVAFSSHANRVHVWHLDRIAEALVALGLAEGGWPTDS